MNVEPTIGDTELDRLQRESFCYFLHEANPANGLIIDKTATNWPASIAATGCALAAYPVAVERRGLYAECAQRPAIAGSGRSHSA